MLAGSLAILGGLYAVGVIRLWRHAGLGRGISVPQAAAFLSGWLTVLLALSPPLDDWSERWQVAHMVQHELLMVIAAPLMAVSAPAIAFMWALPSRARRAAVASVRWRPIEAAWSAVSSPPAAFLLYALALWIWHIPVLYSAALEHEGVHIIQHACFFGSAALFWWGIAHGRYGRSGYGAAVMYVFATAVHGGVLGALLAVSPRVWYAAYGVNHPPGLTPLEDQQLAGLLMWVPASLAFVASALVLFAAWLRQSDRLSRFQSETALRPTQIE